MWSSPSVKQCPRAAASESRVQVWQSERKPIFTYCSEHLDGIIVPSFDTFKEVLTKYLDPGGDNRMLTRMTDLQAVETRLTYLLTSHQLTHR